MRTRRRPILFMLATTALLAGTTPTATADAPAIPDPVVVSLDQYFDNENNVVAMGQRIDLPRDRYHSAHFLVSSSYGMAAGPATVHYADGGTTTATLGGPDWFSGSGAISAPFRYTRPAPNSTRCRSRWHGSGSTRAATPSPSRSRPRTPPSPTCPACTCSR